MSDIAGRRSQVGGRRSEVGDRRSEVAGRRSEIPLQSKIMTITDIFDALTASDRPYKKAVPVTRAVEILEMEVKRNHVDGELVRIFVAA